MKFRIFIFFVWVSCFSIVSSFHQDQEFGHRYQHQPDRPTYSKYAHNTQVYSAHSQFRDHDEPSHVSNAPYSEPQYGSPHQPEAYDKKDPSIYDNIADSSAQSQAKSSYEYKPLVYIPQYQELPRPYPVDKTFEINVPPAEHVYRPDYAHHVAKPWVSQNSYQPTVHQEPFFRNHPIVYSEPQPGVYQHPPPLQHAQPQHKSPPQHAQPQHPGLPQLAQSQHPRPPQYAQPQHSPPPQQTQPQYPPPPQHRTPHQQSTHQQNYYRPQHSYAVPVTHAQADAYATSETNVADILASKPEVKDYLESALLKHYQLDDLGNSYHGKSSDDKLEEHDNDIERSTEKPHNNHENSKHLKKQLLDNDDDQNKKFHVLKKNNHIGNPQTAPEETKHETIPPKKDDNETFYHPRFAYVNQKENPTEINTFPIEVKPENPYHYRNPIVNHNSNAKNPNNILVNEQQKPAVPPTSLDNTDDSFPIESQQLKNYETSTLKDKEVKLYDSDLHSNRSNKQHESPYADKKHSNNEYIPTIKYSQIPNHSTPTPQIIIEGPVDKSEDTLLHGINKPKDSFDDVSPLLFYSGTNDDTIAPLIASPNSNYDKPFKEFHSYLQSKPEVAKPSTDSNLVTNPIVTQKKIVTEIDVTKLNKIDDNKQTFNENVSDNGDKQQKPECDPRSSLTKVITKQSSLEGSPLNVDSLTDDGTSTEDENLQNGDCTSGETNPNNDGDDEEAADSDITNAVLLSSIDLWEKLLAKQPNIEFQAFNVVTLSPIVEKTSRLYAFPNHTTVEESVETVWKCKGDALPLERKFTTIFKYPSQSQDENKCD